jgi:hypothetical protein
MLKTLFNIACVLLTISTLVGACFFRLEPNEKWWHRGIVYLVLIILFTTLHLLTSTH